MQWLFVVGSSGINTATWTFDLARSEPHLHDDAMMLPGRNAKRLADLLATDAAREEGLSDSPAEVVALRLYTGVQCLCTSIAYTAVCIAAVPLATAFQCLDSSISTWCDPSASKQIQQTTLELQ